MINALRNKFILVNMICVTFILIIVFGAIFFYSADQLKADSERTLERALDFSQQKMPIQFKLEKDDEFSGYGAYNFVVRIDYDGTPTLISADSVLVEDETMKDIVNQALDQNTDEGMIKEKGKNVEYQLRYKIREGSSGYDIAFVDVSNELLKAKHMLITCLVASLLCILGFFLVSFFLSKWALRPVEKAWENQKRFAADASHELKTPLTVILANMEILRSNKKEKIEDQMEWVDNTQAEATRMKNLANNLLFLTKNGDMKKPQIKEKVNLSDAVTKTSLAFEPVAFESDIGIDTFIESDLFIGGDESKIRQLMAILLDNAIKYSYDKTIIKVSLKDVSGKAVLEVNNTGVPIAEEDLKNIFERFYRSDKSRSEEGYGLGLSIAKNIADQHRAVIGAKSSEKDGTTFSVVFPAYKA